MTSAGPRTSIRIVTGSSDSLRRTRSFRFKMMSLTSSFTPGRYVNSCSASSKRTWVTAAPGIDDSRVRRSDAAEGVPEAGIERADRETLMVLVRLADRLDGWALDDEHVVDGLLCGLARWLLGVQLDDELLANLGVDLLPQR